jgi:hypothetical protein
MLTLLWIALWLVLSTLMVVAALRLHTRRRDTLASRLPRIDDAAIRAIVETGELRTDEDEPLDLREIDQSEERFWSETWEEPEEF